MNERFLDFMFFNLHDDGTVINYYNLHITSSILKIMLRVKQCCTFWLLEQLATSTADLVKWMQKV